MKQKLTLYHGSPNVVPVPLPGKGNPHNDYGPGFYCTRSLDMAKEWACDGPEIGWANRYVLDCAGLEVLDLSDTRYNILNWLAILLENRTFGLSNPIPSNIRDYILDVFLPDYKSADLIKGYRADDSYFTFARDFLSNSISLSQLERAMKLGLLGEQIVIKSDRAFDAILFDGATGADGGLFHPLRLARDKAAREAYRQIRSEGLREDSLTAWDIVRNKLTSNDLQIR